MKHCEATETQVWLDFTKSNKYIEEADYEILHKEYGHIIAMIKNMINNVDKWRV